MPLPQAIAFVHAMAESQEMQAAVSRMIPEARPALSDVLELGRRFGFRFTESELREAVARDWWMRWAHAGRAQAQAPSENQP